MAYINGVSNLAFGATGLIGNATNGIEGLALSVLAIDHLDKTVS